MSTFTVQLQEFAKKAKGNADDVVGRVVIGLAARIDIRSPVGDPTLWKRPAPPGYVGGAFRGNWQLGIGVVPAGETGRVDPSGGETQGEIVASVPAQAAGPVYYIVNNRPYAQALEDGHSSQAPNGMVGLAVLDYPGLVAEAAATVAA